MSLEPGNALAVRPPRNDDDEHLRLLVIFHYIIGIIAGLLALIPLLYVVLGVFIAALPAASHSPDAAEFRGPAALFGGMFAIAGAALFLFGEVLALCLILAGRYMAQRRHYTLVFVISCVGCLFTPIGTILGILSLVVLSRDTVKAQFAAAALPRPQ